jgi:hypothetical protein
MYNVKVGTVFKPCNHERAKTFDWLIVFMVMLQAVLLERLDGFFYALF